MYYCIAFDKRLNKFESLYLNVARQRRELEIIGVYPSRKMSQGALRKIKNAQNYNKIGGGGNHESF